MREIKFRAWRDGEMLYQQQEGTAYAAALFNRIYSQHPVMQFTGLKDKNGKEIYESDVITTHTGKSMIIGWSNKFASFVINRDGWAFQHWFGEACDPGDCEVIGNIYANPELL